MTAESSSTGSSASAAITALHRHSLDTARHAGRATLSGRATLQTLLDLSRAGELTKTDSVVRVSEPQQVLDVIVELTDVVRTEVLNLLPGGPYPAEWLDQSIDQDIETVQRVSTKSVYTAAVGRDKANRDFLTRYANAGSEVRIADDLPHRLVIFDRTCAVLPVRTDDLNRGALIVREPTMVASLCALYFSIWRQATPLAQFAQAKSDADAPSDNDRAVLVMMSTGTTDEVACARLGVSLRTYRRQIAGVLTKLDAKTRFQAGTRAVERGWL